MKGFVKRIRIDKTSKVGRITKNGNITRERAIKDVINISMLRNMDYLVL